MFKDIYYVNINNESSIYGNRFIFIYGVTGVICYGIY